MFAQRNPKIKPVELFINLINWCELSSFGDIGRRDFSSIIGVNVALNVLVAAQKKIRIRKLCFPHQYFYIPLSSKEIVFASFRFDSTGLSKAADLFMICQLCNNRRVVI